MILINTPLSNEELKLREKMELLTSKCSDTNQIAVDECSRVIDSFASTMTLPYNRIAILFLVAAVRLGGYIKVKYTSPIYNTLITRHEKSQNELFHMIISGLTPSADQVEENFEKLNQSLTSEEHLLEVLGDSWAVLIDCAWRIISGDNSPFSRIENNKHYLIYPCFERYYCDVGKRIFHTPQPGDTHPQFTQLFYEVVFNHPIVVTRIERLRQDIKILKESEASLPVLLKQLIEESEKLNAELVDAGHPEVFWKHPTLPSWH
jgi:hypothetical protein